MDTKEKVKYPRVKKSSTIFFLKTLLFLLVVALIVLIRRMDQMSFRSITEEEALEMVQDIKVTLPDQEVTLMDSGKTQKLKTGKTVKVLGVYKKKLNKGNSPRVYWTNQLYLMELPDGSRAYGPLMETALGQLNVLPEGDTAVITAVKKAKKNPTVQTTGAESRYEYAYTLEGHKEQYALEDLHIYFPERVAYLAKGLREEDYAVTNDTIGENKKDFQKVKKFFLYDIRPITKKVGFFVFPRHQTWNEFYLKRWFRNLMVFFAYLLEIGLIILLFKRRHDIFDNFKTNRKFNRNLRKAKKGDADACYEVGEALEWGYSGWHGVKKSTSPEESLWWYQRAADLGSGKGCAKMGKVYELGNIGKDIDYDMAQKYYQKGADLGDRKCKESKQRLEDLLDYRSEFGQIHLQAKFGISSSMYNLGLYYYNGEYVQSNGKEALKWFQKVADRGDSYGFYGLGLCYLFGKGVNKNIAQALSFFKESLDLGYDHPEDAYYSIALCRHEAYDYQQALANFKKAAELGDTKSFYNIGVYYFNGHGVPRNTSEAYRWWKKGAEAGDEEAIKALKKEGVSY